jgi:NTP pyrophosphatase (non-canonical NTP hydrolase)
MIQREMNHLINRLAERMRVKLNNPRNLAKTPWRQDEYADLWVKLLREVSELGEALKAGVSDEDVWNEAADVAALAMFIADKFEQEEACLTN